MTELREALINLPYYEPGEDIHHCTVETSTGEIDVRQTIRNVIDILTSSIKQLQTIHDNIPENNTLEIYGSGHNIGISGDDQLLQKLIDKELVEEGEFVDEYYDDQNSVSDSEEDD
jgi:hypothetical protein